MVVDDFKGIEGTWRAKERVNGKVNVTKSYKVWLDMKYRCKEGGIYQTKFPTYIGCTFSEMFSSFQEFAGWHIEQVGYGSAGYELDKDILFRFNKHYGEDSCVIVPSALNTFLTSRESKRGLWPQGIYLNKVNKRFISQISIDGVNTYLGCYTGIESAMLAYKVAKEAEAYRWYERLRDGEFVVDPRVIERMRTWTFEYAV